MHLCFALSQGLHFFCDLTAQLHISHAIHTKTYSLLLSICLGTKCSLFYLEWTLQIDFFNYIL